MGCRRCLLCRLCRGGFPGLLPGSGAVSALFPVVGLFLIVPPLVLRQEVLAGLVDAEWLVATLASLLKHRKTADRAVVRGRHVPAHKAAARAGLAGVIGVAVLGLALEQTLSALRAAAGHVLDDGLGVLTFGIARAGKELAKAPELSIFLHKSYFITLCHFVPLQ